MSFPNPNLVPSAYADRVLGPLGIETRDRQKLEELCRERLDLFDETKEERHYREARVIRDALAVLFGEGLSVWPIPWAVDQVTVGQAAAMLGLSYQRVDQLVTEGRIPVVHRLGRFRMLDRAAVLAFREQERPTGRPPKPM